MADFGWPFWLWLLLVIGLGAWGLVKAMGGDDDGS